jgi:hypothetical protein
VFSLMLAVRGGFMLASMSEIDPRAETPLVDWSDLGVSGLLPTGTVTLLLADVEGSTRLWETQLEEMTGAIARFNHAPPHVTWRKSAWEVQVSTPFR